VTADLSNGTDPARAPKREPLKRGLLVDQVAQRVRAEILSGALRPGQRIPVAELSRELAVSPIPIREAMRLLESESLVESAPHQAPVVSDVRLEELGEIYGLRRLIECDTGRLGVERADAAAISAVEAALERLLGADPQDRDSDFWDAHRAFHMAVLQGGLDPWRQRILGLLWQSSERYQRLNTWVFGTTDGGEAAHIEIARAFSAHDADRLARAIANHLDHTERTVTAGYQAAHAEIPVPPRG
jgi:DNA-binding GntR family transcriptional regulator